MSQLFCHVITFFLLLDLDTTANYVECVAHNIQGPMDLCGSTHSSGMDIFSAMVVQCTLHDTVATYIGPSSGKVDWESLSK